MRIGLREMSVNQRQLHNYMNNKVNINKFIQVKNIIQNINESINKIQINQRILNRFNNKDELAKAYVIPIESYKYCHKRKKQRTNGMSSQIQCNHKGGILVNKAKLHYFKKSQFVQKQTINNQNSLNINKVYYSQNVYVNREITNKIHTISPLHVLKQNDKYILINGHHRLKAIQNQYTNDIYIPCIVFENTLNVNVFEQLSNSSGGNSFYWGNEVTSKYQG